jgi:hemin uptake protein HemP
MNWVMSTFQPHRKAPVTLGNKLQTRMAMFSAPGHPLDSGVLFSASSEVVLAHGPELYRLRLTRQNTVPTLPA